MFTSRGARPIVIAVLAVLFAGLRAVAEPPKGAAVPKTPQNLKLDPAIAGRRPPRAVLPTTERLDTLHAAFKEKFALTRAALEARRRVTDECLARAYTPREQQEAGCRPEDSVQTCGEKLLCRCRRAASEEYSSRHAELEVAKRALTEEIRRLYENTQREVVEVTGSYRCAN